MRWAKQQGDVTGYPHSAMHVEPTSAGKRLIDEYDQNASGSLEQDELGKALLPEPFATIDADQDGNLSVRELTQSVDAAANRLPNLAIPEMNGAGAMEICVSTAEGVCDFISAMDKNRRRFISESERPAAKRAYDRAIDRYMKIASEAAN
jgi:hypothetical protein